MAKGKIIYTHVTEKEIEIPDEIIKINEKFSCDMTCEDYDKLEQFSENLWKQYPDVSERCGVYYQDADGWWVIEEY